MAAGSPLPGQHRVLPFCCLLLLCWSGVLSSEDDNFLRPEMHDATAGFQPTAGATASSLRDSGIQTRAEEEARARELMEDSEQDEEQVQDEAERYRQTLKSQQEEEPKAAASAASQHQGLSPEGQRIKEAMEQFDQSQSESDQPELGEGAQVGTQAANTLTVRAQSEAQARAAQAAKWKAIHNAKKVAEKVKQLVAVQRRLEEKASVPHTGYVDRQEAVAATQKVTDAAKMSMHDSLLAQHLEEKAAQKTFQHLIERERREQTQALEAERMKSAEMLATVKATLAKKQQEFMTKMLQSEKALEAKLEHTLANAQVSKAIEHAVRRKLSKRVEQLTSAGQQVVGGVTETVNSLKRRVRRLRRSQDRMRTEQSTVEQRLTSEKATERSYLGESSQNQHLEQELAALRLQMAAQPRVAPPPPEAHPADSNLELENALLKEKLQNSELKNQLLQHSAPARAASPKYSSQKMHRFFENRKREEMARKIRDEEQNLKLMKMNYREYEDAEPEDSDHKPEVKSQLQADVFLQGRIHDHKFDSTYQTLKGKADAVAEDMQSMAEENSVDF